MNLSCSLIQVLAIEQRLVVSGLTESLFPTVEAWFQEDSDRYRSLERIASRKVMDSYRSIADFVLCETIHRYRAPCRAFYDDSGPALREIATQKELKAIESRMLLFLVIAHEAHVQRRRMSWSKAVELVEDALRAA